MLAWQIGLNFRLYMYQVHHWVSDTTVPFVLKVLPIWIKKTIQVEFLSAYKGNKVFLMMYKNMPGMLALP